MHLERSQDIVKKASRQTRESVPLSKYSHSRHISHHANSEFKSKLCIQIKGGFLTMIGSVTRYTSLPCFVYRTRRIGLL
jgi:hypothetical protein